MTTVHVSLPEPLEAFAAEQARHHGFADTGDYLRALVDAVRRQADEDVEAKPTEGLHSEPLPATENLGTLTARAFADLNRAMWDNPEEDKAWADWQ